MSWPKPNLETRHRAAALIAYTETSDVTIRNDYAWRAVTNDKVGMPSFRRDRVEQLLRDGDPEMERAAARILERFEGGAA
jgi:capsular polysaccharide export protein